MICSYTAVKIGESWGNDVQIHVDEIIKGHSGNSCPCCQHEIFSKNAGKKYPSTSSYCNLVVTACDNCGWWKVLAEYVDTYTDSFNANYYFGNVKHYSPSDIEVPILALRSYLKNKPSHMAQVHPHVFEKLIQDCLRSEFDPCEVHHVGRTGDGGVDLILVVSDKESYLVQVKRRSDLTKNEGVKVVRELNGVLFKEGKSKGMVVTTAKDYTKSAIDETKIKTKTEETYVMKLLKFDDIVSMLNLPTKTPYKPWRDLLKFSDLNDYKLDLNIW